MEKITSEKTITKQDNGKEISLKAGEIIQIELEENGSTGYVWQIDNLDKTYFELVAEETRKTETENNLVGAPVVGVWKIKALKKGSSSVKMDYFRSWEGRESAVDHFAVDLEIN
ncbi:MAG: protease inhibitor I42 family protein [Candidatus Moraniibacteriota bacterium]